MFFIAILPSYFLSSVKNRIVDNKLEIQKNEIVPSLDQKIVSTIKDINEKLDLIDNAQKDKFIISERVVNNILLERIPNIKITNISYEENSQSGSQQDKKIVVQGNASSREVLLQFRNALEDDVAFKQVELPISNFVKGSNIQFYLSLIPS